LSFFTVDGLLMVILALHSVLVLSNNEAGGMCSRAVVG
jgi:hypothetical protein